VEAQIEHFVFACVYFSIFYLSKLRLSRFKVTFLVLVGLGQQGAAVPIPNRLTPQVTLTFKVAVRTKRIFKHGKLIIGTRLKVMLQ
jgi:hypothetical protein